MCRNATAIVVIPLVNNHSLKSIQDDNDDCMLKNPAVVLQVAVVLLAAAASQPAANDNCNECTSDANCSSS